MDRDFIIGVVLLFGLFIVWQQFGPKPAPVETPTAATEKSPEKVPDTANLPAPGLTPAPAIVATAPEPGSGLSNAGTVPAGGVAVPSAPVLPPIEVETANTSAKFTNEGGRLLSFRLKHFNDAAGPSGKPLEMVSQPETGLLPLSTYWVGAGPSLAERDPYEIVSHGADRIVFRRADAKGFVVTKTYEPDPSGYSMKLTVDIENTGTENGQGRLSIATFQRPIIAKKSFFGRTMDIVSSVAYVAGSLEKKPIEKADQLSYPNNVIWAGFESLYFLAAVAPGVSESTQAQVLAGKTAEAPYTSVITMAEKALPPGSKTSFLFTAFLGPKTEEVLGAAGHNFDQALDFGWFTFIAKLLVRVLQFFYKYCHNWGLAIIIVTIIIKILLLPLTQKSYTSMRAMSALQPAMQELREKFKDDREKLNQEMMGLYKAHGVNPASGCIPMLAQFPVFLAFYRALYGTIELRHAPFMLWIQDLSAPDPYYVTPIVMGASMVITQKMTPTSADPMQAKMMMLMPIVFTFFFLNLPSGLVVYWLVSNVLSIFQQLYLRRGEPPKPAPPVKGAKAAA